MARKKPPRAKWLPPKQAAAYLGTSPWMLWHKTRQGRLEPGRHYRCSDTGRRTYNVAAIELDEIENAGGSLRDLSDFGVPLDGRACS